MMVRGLISPTVVSGDRLAALAVGNIDALMRINRAEFGGYVMMADLDDDDEDKDKDESGEDDGDSGADDDTDKDKSSDGDSDEDLERMRKRMRVADRRREEAERKLREQEDAKKDALTKATDDLTAAQDQIKDLTGQISSLRLENAFLTANKQEWHDPDIALGLAQNRGYLEDVVDEESGEVDKKALKKALDRLATEHKYLVKSATDEAKDKDLPPSGESSGGRSDNLKDGKAKEKVLRNRFPVLNR